MAIQALKLRISTPTEPIPPGRGFYQLEEDSLYVQIGLFSRKRRFFSYLESDHVSMDFDREGRLIFIKINLTRRLWPTNPELAKPDAAEMADIRFLDFRETIRDPSFSANADRTVLHLEFSAEEPTHNCYLADSVILQADDQSNLVAIWVNDILDDVAGREIAAFRKDCRRGTIMA